MDASSVQRAYSRWARVYDWIFGPAFQRARARAVEVMDLGADADLLEVGVGTGLSIPFFPRDARVIGIDFSRPMLERATGRCRAARRCALVEGDGAALPFAARTFDAVLAPYVVSAAPDPVGILKEMARVCRPGGKLVVLNHFSAANRWIAALERRIEPLTARLLGFHAHFPLHPVFDAAGLEVEHVERVPPLRYWHLVRCTALHPDETAR